MQNNRNCGIDLLRLVLMFMVCMLHILGQGGVLSENNLNAAGYPVFRLLEVCSYCAVDGFAIISGYISSNRSPKWYKLTDMWFQVFFYSFIMTIILRIAGVGSAIDTATYIRLLMPVTSKTFWYFSAYFILVFAMPMLNKFIESISAIAAKKAIVIMMFLFSIMSIYADPFNVQRGYSAIWLMGLYTLGGLAKKAQVFSARRSSTLILLLVCSSVLSWAGIVILDTDLLISYVSPTILLNALILVVLFSRIRCQCSWITRISSMAFGVYLFQLNTVIWNDILQSSMQFVTEKKVIVGVLCVLLSAIVLFVSGLTVEYLRSKVAKMLKVSSLSMKIVDTISNIVSRFIVLLK